MSHPRCRDVCNTSPSRVMPVLRLSLTVFGGRLESIASEAIIALQGALLLSLFVSAPTACIESSQMRCCSMMPLRHSLRRYASSILCFARLPDSCLPKKKSASSGTHLNTVHQYLCAYTYFIPRKCLAIACPRAQTFPQESFWLAFCSVQNL